MQLAPAGPSCRSIRVLQLLQRWYLVHFAGLQKPWQPGSCRPIAGFLSIGFDNSLELKSRNGRTGARKDTIQVILLDSGLGPCLEGRQLIGVSWVWATTSSVTSSAELVTVLPDSCRIVKGTPGTA